MGIDNEVIQKPDLTFKSLEQYLQKNLKLTEEEARMINFAAQDEFFKLKDEENLRKSHSMGLKIWLEDEEDYFAWFISDGEITKNIAFIKPTEEIKNSYEKGKLFISYLTALLDEFYQLKFSS